MNKRKQKERAFHKRYGVINTHILTPDERLWNDKMIELCNGIIVKNLDRWDWRADVNERTR